MFDATAGPVRNKAQLKPFFDIVERLQRCHAIV